MVVKDWKMVLADVFLVITIIVATIVTYMLIQLIVGNSPNIAEVNLGFTIMLTTCFMTFGFRINNQLGALSAQVKQNSRLIQAIGRDLKTHLNDNRRHLNP